MTDGSPYEIDLVRWSEEQAGAIRHAAAANANLPLDWENIAEEIESLGKSQRAELTSRTRTIVEHLLKLECSPMPGPRNGWRETVRLSRTEIEYLLDGSPSLRGTRPEILALVQDRVARDTAETLADAGENLAPADAASRAGRYTVEHVFGRRFPGEDA